jgi:hypothetical protein
MYREYFNKLKMSSQYSVRKNVKSYERIYVILFVRDRQSFVDINNIKRINREILRSVAPVHIIDGVTVVAADRHANHY